MPRGIVPRAIAVTSLGGVLGLATLARDVYVGRLYGYSPEIKNYASAVLLSVILINSAGGAMAASYCPFFYQRARDFGESVTKPVNDPKSRHGHIVLRPNKIERCRHTDVPGSDLEC